MSPHLVVGFMSYTSRCAIFCCSEYPRKSGAAGVVEGPTRAVIEIVVHGRYFFFLSVRY